MPRITLDLPDDLHQEISAAIRKHKLNMTIATSQAFRLWLKQPPEKISQMSGLLADLPSSADRKRLEKYAELLRTGREDVKKVASRRIAALLSFTYEDIGH